MSDKTANRAVSIEYCTGWGYLGRAASLAESILHDFHKELPGGVTLVPSSGGVLEISLDGKLIFSKKARERYPNENEVEDTLASELGVER
jgi:selenoprotein W-related protein